jgi:hypothetical protein
MHKYDEFGLMPYQIPMNVWFDNTTKKLVSILILCLWLACDYCPNQLILWLHNYSNPMCQMIANIYAFTLWQISILIVNATTIWWLPQV